MATRDVPTHPAAGEEPQQQGFLGKVKQTLGLGGASHEAHEEGHATVTERVKETAEAAKETVAGPGTPSRAGPVCAASEVRAPGRPRLWVMERRPAAAASVPASRERLRVAAAAGLRQQPS